MLFSEACSFSPNEKQKECKSETEAGLLPNRFLERSIVVQEGGLIANYHVGVDLQRVNIKVHAVVLGKYIYSFLMPKQTMYTNSLCFHDWINWIYKLILKDNTVSYCFTLFTCGRPCHLSSFKQCSAEYGNNIYVCVITSLTVQILQFWVWISSPKTHSAPLSDWITGY